MLIGLDGGGTRTRIAFAADDEAGAGDGARELARADGPAGLVDPRDPATSAAGLASLIRDTASEAGVSLPAAALCAGLAGAGAPALRAAMREALASAGVADRILVVGDGEIALEGALAGAPGILLVAGTGSVAHGRAEDGRVARCGGYGMIVGDEGGGYAIAVAGLRAALQAADGRCRPTALVAELLPALGLAAPADVPPWVGRAEKAAVAALAPRVIRLAPVDDVAAAIIDDAADHLAAHVLALLHRLGPWSAAATPVPVVFHGGALGEDELAGRVAERLDQGPIAVARRAPIADALTGALRRARDHRRASARP